MQTYALVKLLSRYRTVPWENSGGKKEKRETRKNPMKIMVAPSNAA